MSGVEENITLSEGKLHLSDSKLIMIKYQPIMECALDILTELVKHKMITLKAVGESIPTAVAVANVITENMLKGNSKILDISVDSESVDEKHNLSLISTIKITILKTN